MARPDLPDNFETKAPPKHANLLCAIFDQKHRRLRFISSEFLLFSKFVRFHACLAAVINFEYNFQRNLCAAFLIYQININRMENCVFEHYNGVNQRIRCGLSVCIT